MISKLKVKLRAPQATSDNLAAQRQPGAWFKTSAERAAPLTLQGHPQSITPSKNCFPFENSLGIWKRQMLVPAQHSGEKYPHGRGRHARTVRRVRGYRQWQRHWVILGVLHGNTGAPWNREGCFNSGRTEQLWVQAITDLLKILALSIGKCLILNSDFQSWSDRTKELFDAWNTWQWSLHAHFLTGYSTCFSPFLALFGHWASEMPFSGAMLLTCSATWIKTPGFTSSNKSVLYRWILCLLPLTCRIRTQQRGSLAVNFYCSRSDLNAQSKVLRLEKYICFWEIFFMHEHARKTASPSTGLWSLSVALCSEAEEEGKTADDLGKRLKYTSPKQRWLNSACFPKLCKALHNKMSKGKKWLKCQPWRNLK